jgi:hypothetical protein
MSRSLLPALKGALHRISASAPTTLHITRRTISHRRGDLGPINTVRSGASCRQGRGVPANQLPLISRTLTLQYESIICRDAFNITTPPNTDAVNKYGGFNIAYNRLTFVNGEVDPRRPSTPASPQAPNPNRMSTANMPFVVISGAVHHWVKQPQVLILCKPF